ncbi:DMT family transporter [Pseudovibrio sp. Tun.PSC04-5.I4]|uniref:DMT family transporter n=1 Tax=Pseudovibrio sp. Tun.PSC04-5.I4 TaxID=1798213 RepID=UPI0008825D27|nr:DMT family transporter [Pseudovibrio sp. Tun.PSC04-5.I4]SDQ32251.1 Permease of the drug/metabolite transporter (DMT) superfamily [Pseudovibrio sp. Tun.PSC04-5.I4]
MTPRQRLNPAVIANQVLPLLFVILYSSGYVASKIGIAYTDPFTFQTLRLATPVPLFLGIIFLTKAKWHNKPIEVFHICVTGILIHGFCFTGMLVAYEWGMDVGTVGLIMALHPALASVGAIAFLGERFSFKLILGLLLGTIGVLLVVNQKASFDSNSYSGVLLTVLCLLSMVAGVLYQKRFVAHMNLMTGSLIQHLSALIPVFGLMIAFETMTINWSASLIGSILWLGIVLSMGSWILFFILIRSADVSRSQSYFFLGPPTTVLLAWIFFDEQFGSYFLLSLSLIVAGILIVTKHTAPKVGENQKSEQGLTTGSAERVT